MATLTCPNPANINPLSPTGFLLSIQKLPTVAYFAQEVTLPSVDLPPIDVNTPLSRISVTGETLSYGEFTINFMIDEDMQNYVALYDWLKGLGFPQDHEQYKDYIENSRRESNSYMRSENLASYSDATFSILGSNNIPIRTITFVDMHPVSLSSLQFTANATDVNYLIGSATFRYTYFDIV
jgi:hypothetical protein